MGIQQEQRRATAVDKIKGWETKMMRRLFLFRRKEDATITEYCTRTVRVAKYLLENMKLPFQSEINADSRWRAFG